MPPWDKYKSPGSVVAPADPYKPAAEKRADAADARSSAQLALSQAANAREQARFQQEQADLKAELDMVSAPGAIKAIAEGRLPLSARLISSPRGQQILKAVTEYDPTFDAVDYNARLNTRKDFTSGKSAQNIKALNTAIGHVGQLADQISGTASHGGFPLATTANAVQNWWDRGSGDPGVTNYEQTASAVASELTQVFRGSGGAEADVKRYLSELSSSASEAQKSAAVKNIVGLLNSRLQAIGDQYKKGMGTADQGIDILDPHAKEVLGKLGFPQGGDDHKPIPGIGAGGNTPPTLPGSGGPTSTPDDIAIQNKLEGAYAAGASLDAIKKLSGDLGRPLDGSLADQWSKAVQSRDAGTPYGPGTPPASGTAGALNDIAKNPFGAGAESYLNAAAFGVPQLLAGDAPFDAMHKENPKASITGDIAGGLTGTLLGGAGLLRAGVSPTAAGLGANIGYGSLFGANTSEGNRAGGAAGGIVAALLGEGIGRYALAPAARAIGDTNVARALLAKIGDAPPSPVSRIERSIAADVQPRIDQITQRLSGADALGLPYSIADADPALRQTLGSAARLSPNVDSSLRPQLRARNNDQAPRFIGALNEMAPVVNIADTSAAIKKNAWDTADPIYRQAFAMPAPDNAEINAVLNTPYGSSAARNAYDSALNQNRSPAEIGLRINPDGSTALDASPTYETLDAIKRGFGTDLKPHRNPMTGQLDLTDNQPAKDTLALQQRLVAAMDAENPLLAQARATYAANIRPATALDNGYKATATSFNNDNVAAALAALKSPAEGSAFRSGYTTSLADAASRPNINANPWNRYATGLNNESKLETIFGPDHAIAQRLPFEQDMAATAGAVMGNSETAARQAADARFAGGNDMLGNVAELGASAAMGVPPVGMMTRAAGSGVKRLLGNRSDAMTQQSAEQIAPLLANQDPAAASQQLQDMIAAILQRKNYEDYIKSAAGLGTGGVAAALLGGP